MILSTALVFFFTLSLCLPLLLPRPLSFSFNHSLASQAYHDALQKFYTESGFPITTAAAKATTGGASPDHLEEKASQGASAMLQSSPGNVCSPLEKAAPGAATGGGLPSVTGVGPDVSTHGGRPRGNAAVRMPSSRPSSPVMRGVGGAKASPQVASNAAGETVEDVIGGSTIVAGNNTTPKDQFYVLEEIPAMPTAAAVAAVPSVGNESADHGVSSGGGGLPTDVSRPSPHKRLSHDGAERARQSDVGAEERGIASMSEDREISFNGEGGGGGGRAVFVHSPWLIGGKKKVLHKRPLVESNEVSKLEAQMRSPYKVGVAR